jgi:UDP-glucose 4-epimerase
VTILLTGASGFLGRAIARDLAARGHDLRLALRRPDPTSPGEQVRIGDLAGPVDWAPTLDGVETVIHAAAIAHVDGVDPALHEAVNHAATTRLAKAAQVAAVRRFLFISSIRAQSGATATHVLTEDDAPAPTDPYGRAKLAAERDLAATSLDWVALRPVLIHGPGVKGNMAALMRLARLPVPLPLGGLTGRRSLVGIDSVCGAVAHLLSLPRLPDAPLIVADPDPLTVPQIVTALRAGLGRRPGLLPVPAAALGALARLAGRGDAFDRIAGDLVASPGRLQALGWQPASPGPEALAKLMQADSQRMDGAGKS